MLRMVRDAAAARPLRDRLLLATPPGSALHPLGRLDPDEVEAARNYALRRVAEAEPERLRLRSEDATLVVEAVVGVGEPDRVDGDSLRSPVLRRLPRDRGEVAQAFDQVALLA